MTWIIAGAVIIVLIVLGGILIPNRSESKADKLRNQVAAMGANRATAVEPRSDTSLMSPAAKVELDAMEKKIFAKADYVKRIADEDTNVIVDLETVEEPEIVEHEKDPLEESAFLRSIADKVERVKKLSSE